MFSWDNNSHNNPQFSKAKDNFKRKVTDERDVASLLCVVLHAFVYQLHFRGKWEYFIQNRIYYYNLEGNLEWK